jgi:hypothetical protein
METLLELSSKSSMVLDSNNSTFTTLFGEPIKVAAGSTINFTNAFIDLGLESADLITIPTNIQLGMNFYRYDEDIPKVPKVQGTDPTNYQKATIYYEKQSTGASTIIENSAAPPPNTTFGWRTSIKEPTLLPAFLLDRTERNRVAAGHVAETFVATEQTASINIPAGFYSRTKFLQLVNDGFNLIGGSLTNTDKPLQNKVGANKPFAMSPYDYQLAPNNNSNLLKSFEYSYATWDPVATDPDTTGIANTFKSHPSDKVWPSWFFPIYTEPSNPALFLDEPYPPYVWMATDQTGFLSGTTKFNLNYDQENQIFFIDYAHSPILDSEQREIVQFSRQKTAYANASSFADSVENTGYKANGRAGGIMISRLFSLELDDTFTPVSQTNTNFWQKYLGFGFDDDFHTQFIADLKTEVRTFYAGSANLLYWVQTLTYPDPKYFDTCTTNALIPIAWLQQQNWTDPDDDRGFSIVVNDIPKTFQSIGSRNILGTSGQQFSEPTSHFLIELNIHNIRNDNYRDIDSYRQIAAVAGKTYPSTASYIQSFDDAAIQTLIMNEDTWIDKVEVRILNPDKTPAIELGENTTIFIKLTQPVVVNQPQAPN